MSTCCFATSDAQDIIELLFFLASETGYIFSLDIDAQLHLPNGNDEGSAVSSCWVGVVRDFPYGGTSKAGTSTYCWA